VTHTKIKENRERVIKVVMKKIKNKSTFYLAVHHDKKAKKEISSSSKTQKAFDSLTVCVCVATKNTRKFSFCFCVVFNERKRLNGESGDEQTHIIFGKHKHKVTQHSKEILNFILFVKEQNCTH